jgi:hypothetical protein
MSVESRRAAARRLRDTFLAQKGEAWLRFQGRSMAPLLRDGDLLRVRHGASALARGAIVVFNDGDATIVHRFLCRRRRAGVMITKGDNAWRFDRPLAPERLIGTVCEIRRGADRITIDRGGWQWVSRGIAWTSMLEGIACACAAAVRRRCLPQRLLGRVGEARVLAAIGRCRRAVIDRLLRAVGSTSAGTA